MVCVRSRGAGLWAGRRAAGIVGNYGFQDIVIIWGKKKSLFAAQKRHKRHKWHWKSELISIVHRRKYDATEFFPISGHFEPFQALFRPFFLGHFSYPGGQKSHFFGHLITLRIRGGVGQWLTLSKMGAGAVEHSHPEFRKGWDPSLGTQIDCTTLCLGEFLSSFSCGNKEIL